MTTNNSELKIEHTPEELLHKNIERLRKAFVAWSRASAAYNALAGIQDGSAPTPVIEFTTSHDGKPVTVAIDLADLPKQELLQTTDALMGPVIQQYETSLHNIYKASKAAYRALQKQKEM
jgi:hypothetical protein